MPRKPKAKKAPEPALPPGQPTKYDSSFCIRLIKHMSQGLSFESFGAEVDVCEQTLYNWRAAHPDFLESYKRGKVKSLRFWEQMGVAGAFPEKNGRRLSAETWKWNMMNRFGWSNREKTVTEDDDIYKELMEEIEREEAQDVAFQQEIIDAKPK